MNDPERLAEVFRLHALLADHIETHSPRCSLRCVCNVEERREALNKLASWAAGARYTGDE